MFFFKKVVKILTYFSIKHTNMNNVRFIFERQYGKTRRMDQIGIFCSISKLFFIL